MVNVRSIADMGAYVHLLEYNNIEGMILLSELSRRRIRSINKLIRIGRDECVVVIRVDKDKGQHCTRLSVIDKNICYQLTEMHLRHYCRMNDFTCSSSEQCVDIWVTPFEDTRMADHGEAWQWKGDIRPG